MVDLFYPDRYSVQSEFCTKGLTFASECAEFLHSEYSQYLTQGAHQFVSHAIRRLLWLDPADLQIGVIQDSRSGINSTTRKGLNCHCNNYPG